MCHMLNKSSDRGSCLSKVKDSSVRCIAGVFVSSWLGGLLLQVGEWIIKKLPLVKHIYSAAKQVIRQSVS